MNGHAMKDHPKNKHELSDTSNEVDRSHSPNTKITFTKHTVLNTPGHKRPPQANFLLLFFGWKKKQTVKLSVRQTQFMIIESIMLGALWG